MIAFVLGLIGWCVIPLSYGLVFADTELGLIYLLAVSSFSVYSTVIAGWASHSKYALLGSLRSAAQMISYEVAMGLSIMSVIISCSSTNLTDIVVAQVDI